MFLKTFLNFFQKTIFIIKKDTPPHPDSNYKIHRALITHLHSNQIQIKIILANRTNSSNYPHIQINIIFHQNFQSQINISYLYALKIDNAVNVLCSTDAPPLLQRRSSARSPP